jgi:hypothetical protein
MGVEVTLVAANVVSMAHTDIELTLVVAAAARTRLLNARR